MGQVARGSMLNGCVDSIQHHQRQLGSSRTPARDLRHSKERAQEVRMSSENGAYHRRLGPVQGVWWMECIGARQTCKKNGLERRQERLERTCGSSWVGFQRKVKRVVLGEKEMEGNSSQTAADHTISMCESF